MLTNEETKLKLLFAFPIFIFTLQAFKEGKQSISYLITYCRSIPEHKAPHNQPSSISIASINSKHTTSQPL